MQPYFEYTLYKINIRETRKTTQLCKQKKLRNLSHLVILFLDGSDVGPQIELSSGLVKDGDTLTYICREGGDDEDNRLAQVMDDGSLIEFGELHWQIQQTIFILTN